VSTRVVMRYLVASKEIRDVFGVATAFEAIDGPLHSRQKHETAIQKLDQESIATNVSEKVLGIDVEGIGGNERRRSETRYWLASD
jgi:hypothetical protein